MNDADAIRRLGQESPAWRRVDRSVFGDQPHWILRDPSWDEQAQATIERYLVLSENAGPRLYVTTLQAYSASALDAILYSAGFQEIHRDVSMPTQTGLGIIIATR